MSKTNPAFAEIIESSITHATGLCWNWSTLPLLCALVKIHQPPYTLFGCISNIKTGSNDPLRQPVAYQKTAAELLQEQPQIFAFLQTTFTIKILGYQKDNTYSYFLPPQPAKLHTFIEYSSPDEVALFLSNPEFLNLFFIPSENEINLDELLLALIRNLKNSCSVSVEFMQKLCSYRANMHSVDYKNMKRFMQRLQQLSNT